MLMHSLKTITNEESTNQILHTRQNRVSEQLLHDRRHPDIVQAVAQLIQVSRLIAKNVLLR